MSEQVLYEMNDQMFSEYKLKVVRATVGGHLTVLFKDKAIYEQEVPLAYNAQYGPDGFDIESWGSIACQVVDDHREKHVRD